MPRSSPDKGQKAETITFLMTVNSQNGRRGCHPEAGRHRGGHPAVLRLVAVNENMF